jgi:hypothetical protein
MPIKGVVPHLSCVIENTTAGGLDDLFQSFVFKFSAWDQVVQVNNISVMVFTVVVFQCFLRNVRCQSIFFGLFSKKSRLSSIEGTLP